MRYVRTDTADDAAASLELTLEFYIRACVDDRYWKWFTIAFHTSLQGLFAMALENGNGLLVQKPNTAKRMVAAWDDDTATPPPPSMDHFVELYKKLQDPRNLRSQSALPISPSKELDEAIVRLNDLRNEFVHFNVKSWSVEKKLIVARVTTCLSVAEHLCSTDQVIWWHSAKHKKRAKVALRKLRALLPEANRSATNV